MAFSLNQIGPYPFIRLDGAPLLPREESIAITRPGVPGTGFMKTAKRGKLFTLKSTVDVLDWATAQTTNDAYHSLANSSLVDVIFGGVNYGTLSIRFNVVDVEVVEIRRLTNTVGGLVAGEAVVVANWQLIGVKV